ncbi:MAG: 16S rRNA (uracil(1498)-N(3))-methyltransferase [Gammaproteobacteria bacterium]
MPRFYCPQPLAAGATVQLPEAVAHHLHVVRMQPGDDITLFNGEGGEYTARLAAIEKRRASATVTEFSAREVELPYAITLAQALPEAAKMDWIIEKAVEMGVAAIEPLAAQRCVVKLTGERADKRQAHWQGVIEAASEQSGRNRLARLAGVQAIGPWLARPATQPRLLLSPRGTGTLAEWARGHAPQDVTLMIGPEGGFTAQEEDAALAHGAVAVTMGARILRTETAGIAAAATLCALWGA